MELLSRTKKWGALLLILPLVYVAILLNFISGLGSFYSTGFDPVYAYLFNGLNIAGGNMEVGHFDHPGTTVQCYAALIISLQHLISGSGLLSEDVLSNPESYMFSCSIGLILILGIITYFTGRYVYRNTGFLSAAFIFQLLPLVNCNAGNLYTVPFLRPESFMILAGIFFTAYIYVSIADEEAGWNNRKIYIIAFFSAFLIITKIPCAPFVLPVIFMFKNRKQRVRYLLSMIFFIALLLIPAWGRLPNMYKWITDVITHDGLYGGGNTQLINKEAFFSNLKEVYTDNFIFSGSLIIEVFVLFVAIKRHKKAAFHNTSVRLLFGILLATFILSLMVAKHYKSYYITPALVFLPLGLMLSGNIFAAVFESKPFFVSGKFTRLFIFPALFINGCGGLFLSIDAFSYDQNPLKETRRFVDEHKDEPVVINWSYETAQAYIEPAIFFGISYAGNLRAEYYSFIKQKYPQSYIYFFDGSNLSNWSTGTFSGEVLQKHPVLLMYFIQTKEDDEKRTIETLFTVNNKFLLKDVKKVFTNENTHESFYELTADTLKTNNLFHRVFSFSSDFESVVNATTSFSTTDSLIVLGGADQLNTEEHLSGKNSVKIDAKHQYGIVTDLQVKPGDMIEVTIWRKADDKTGDLVLQAANSALFYAGGEIHVKFSDDGNWEQILCRGRVPENFPDKTVKLLIFYNGHNEAYFDDISLKIYSM